MPKKPARWPPSFHRPHCPAPFTRPLFHHNLRLPVSPARPAELANLPGERTHEFFTAFSRIFHYFPAFWGMLASIFMFIHFNTAFNLKAVLPTSHPCPSGPASSWHRAGMVSPSTTLHSPSAGSHRAVQNLRRRKWCPSSLAKLVCNSTNWDIMAGWWFQTFFMFHNAVYGIILPID